MVAIDEAHSNFHTASGQYKPFTDLLTADGYRVVGWKDTFAAGVLAKVIFWSSQTREISRR